mgnify:CR=1 FL=1
MTPTLTPPEDSPDERNARIRKARDTDACRCGGKVESQGSHERDSTYDIHTCGKCGWFYIEMEVWDLDD